MTDTMTTMKTKFMLFMLLCALCACGSLPKDVTLPEILPAGDATAPLNCQVYYRGSVIFFDYLFSDDTELGAYNLEIHNNFDHHTHSTESGECRQDPVKQPVNPWIYNQDFSIPGGSKLHEAEQTISVPDDVDPGEYHFMIRLTDRSGWQQIKSVSIRIQ